MEAENQQLKQALAQKQSQVKTLESRLTSTQLDLQESQEKVRQVAESYITVVAEVSAAAAHTSSPQVLAYTLCKRFHHAMHNQWQQAAYTPTMCHTSQSIYGHMVWFVSCSTLQNI